MNDQTKVYLLPDTFTTDFLYEKIEVLERALEKKIEECNQLAEALKVERSGNTIDKIRQRLKEVHDR